MPQSMGRSGCITQNVSRAVAPQAARPRRSSGFRLSVCTLQSRAKSKTLYTPQLSCTTSPTSIESLRPLSPVHHPTPSPSDTSSNVQQHLSDIVGASSFSARIAASNCGALALICTSATFVPSRAVRMMASSSGEAPATACTPRAAHCDRPLATRRERGGRVPGAAVARAAPRQTRRAAPHATPQSRGARPEAVAPRGRVAGYLRRSRGS